MLLVVTMLEAYMREMRCCLSERSEIEYFPHADVFKMITKEVGTDARLLLALALDKRVKALLLKITNQIRSGDFDDFDDFYVEKKLAVLRSLFRFSQQLNAAL